MTGSASDPLDWQPHIRNKQRRKELASQFRDPSSPFKIVIVRDIAIHELKRCHRNSTHCSRLRCR